MSRIKVFVADSNASVRQFIKYALEDNFPNVAIDMANSGKNIQQRLESTRYDLILYEREMPFLDGDTFLEWLRNHAILNSTPFIMMSPNRDEETLKKAIKLGADAYLLKPFKADNLVSNVTTALNRLNRRKSERYRTAGTVVFTADSLHCRGTLVNISLEGVSAKFVMQEGLPAILKRVAVNIELEDGPKLEGLDCLVIRIEALNPENAFERGAPVDLSL